MSRRSIPRVALLVGLLGSTAVAQVGRQGGDQHRLRFLEPVSCTRIADPKLDGGQVEVAYRLLPNQSGYRVKVQVFDGGGAKVATIARGREQGSTSPIVHTWDGRDAGGLFCDLGTYRVHVEASADRTQTLDYDVSVVRLGVTEVAALPSAGENEWQMVYFMKRGNYAFYAVPAEREYLNVRERGEISDLDLDDGSPRPPVPIYTETDTPLTEQRTGGSWRYENDAYNYPICYAIEAAPLLQATFGATATSSQGTEIGAGYPVPGYEIRARASDGTSDWASADVDIAPGGTASFTGPLLPSAVTRTDVNLTWSYEYRAVGGDWESIPGQHSTWHRIYTNYDAPQWAAGASGTQYSGPWVEVADYFSRWQEALGIVPDTPRRVVECLTKGYFGQNGPLTEAIEGVHYDCPSEGGDGGATHYYQWSYGATELSRLLNYHDNGVYVNCSDVASTTSVMLGMLGIPNSQMVRLGNMTLRAIWGIGTDDYTLDLWGGSHGFSYHHIITRNGGAKVSDACMWLDEDGDPDHLPGTPGYNHDRTWGSYNDLSARNNVEKSLDPLPKIW